MLYFNTDHALLPDPAAKVRSRFPPVPFVTYNTLDLNSLEDAGCPVGVRVVLTFMASVCIGLLTSILTELAGVICSNVPEFDMFPRVMDFKLSESEASAIKSKSPLAALVISVAPFTTLDEPEARSRRRV